MSDQVGNQNVGFLMTLLKCVDDIAIVELKCFHTLAGSITPKATDECPESKQTLFRDQSDGDRECDENIDISMFSVILKPLQTSVLCIHRSLNPLTVISKMPF